MQQLRLLHIALCLSAAIMTAVFGALRTLMPDSVAQLPSFVPWVFLALSASIIGGAVAFRTTIAPVDSAAGEEAWLVTARGKAIALWALCESGVVMAALAFYFGAIPLIAGGFAAAGLGFMASQSPGTLAGH